MKTIRPWLFAAILASACSSGPSAKERLLEAEVHSAKRLFDRTRTDPMASASFWSLAEMGGTEIHYLTASLPEKGEITCYAQGAPTGPWCVVVRSGPGENQVTVEGYGEKLDKPLYSEVAVIGEARRE